MYGITIAKQTAIPRPIAIPENLVLITPANNLPSLPKSFARYSTLLEAFLIPRVFGLFENLTIYKTSNYAPNNGAIINKKPITKVNTKPIIIPCTLPE